VQIIKELGAPIRKRKKSSVSSVALLISEKKADPSMVSTSFPAAFFSSAFHLVPPHHEPHDVSAGNIWFSNIRRRFGI
jgi:hypothetical protein